ncbi:glyoxalase superfamily protein [Nonomuraea sp. NPDC059023]|uniref:glyoxalase superfamily protein n=1 Tax=unclassified Nonomuraea TaxID=2593643 RepID=UPI0036AA1D87
MDMTLTDAKRAAAILRDDLAQADSIDITHSRALEIVARQLGHRDWNTAAAALGHTSGARLGSPIAVLRIQDEGRAREFYLDYLGFTVEWEHRFEPGMPLYMRVHRDRMIIDLSEHHGDGTPGSLVWTPVGDVGALHRELTAKPYPRLRPGIDQDAPGGPTLEVTDPFSNVIRFCQVEG